MGSLTFLLQHEPHWLADAVVLLPRPGMTEMLAAAFEDSAGAPYLHIERAELVHEIGCVNIGTTHWRAGSPLLLVLQGGGKGSYDEPLATTLGALAPYLVDAAWWSARENGPVVYWHLAAGRVSRRRIDGVDSIEDGAVAHFSEGSSSWRSALWERIRTWIDTDGERALDDLDALAAHGASGPRLLRARAHALLTEEEPRPALAVLEPLLVSGDEEALELAIRAARDLGDDTAALAWSRQLLEQTRTPAACARHAALLLANGALDEAAMWAGVAVGTESSEPLVEGLRVLALTHARRREADDALRVGLAYVTCSGAPHVATERARHLAADPEYRALWSRDDAFGRLLGPLPNP